MKSFILTVFLIAVFFTAYSQSNFRIDSEKFYDDGSRIIYITLDKTLTDFEKEILENELLKNFKVNNFSFYDSQNSDKIMLNTSDDFEIELIDKIINKIFNVEKDKNINDLNFYDNKVFIKSEFENNNYKVSFFVENASEKELIMQIYDILKNSNTFTSISIHDNFEIFLESYNPILPKDVQKLLAKYNVFISKEFVK
ncbi:MAG TPA: hypothetical protein P5538_09905 [Bacteroidales bacterium]|jgi:hypothetical protein|nr:hypothetical protein [Bacteroidales bacterium]HOL99043.1 hypothetical protein [Bacteroidales bacterium]HOM37434.1 hypothetical protein [Bacteroidales bacterium]HPD24922.1 hypothetical protein [Bacteroidales bacterium]HRT00613.1 hypothetical protein [Bacteroidales bacterium]